ncbi:2-iminobutanoate/2-iminopropanoate deaminase [Jejuia pallidilutea]|uniref:2-iminobutanoate/2-iminopropanoate deaminase n=1 Tax=Jejuia pallidilutea TaxID=504487 RepID=A0A362WXY2_9FLAO|nr:Rid family detoxifying hydrolase [Jejuia pallidilutea]PQV46601.1 2-iminobutanoate/2-iminopropanoate deaminase [Jejuia pallidilutea]
MKSTILFAIIITLLCSSCEEHKNTVIFHKSHEPQRQNIPFSEVVETNNLLFLSGQIGKNHNTGILVEGGIKAETKQTIENIQAILQHHDSGLENVVKCTVILNDINEFESFNEVYTQYFTKKPARTTFAAEKLAANASVEIDVIAVKGTVAN